MTRVRGLLLAALLASIAGQWVGAAGLDRRLTFAYAALGALALVAAGAATNRHAFMAPRSAATGPTGARKTARANAILIATAWLWGGLSMLTVYLFSGLRWQHGWQYGCAMALIGAAVLIYALGRSPGRLDRPAPPAWARRLTALQSVTATAALLWLLFSGKLFVDKPDWAANAIFLAGGVALVILSDLALAADARLAARARHTRPLSP